ADRLELVDGAVRDLHEEAFRGDEGLLAVDGEADLSGLYDPYDPVVGVHHRLGSLARAHRDIAGGEELAVNEGLGPVLLPGMLGQDVGELPVGLVGSGPA